MNYPHNKSKGFKPISSGPNMTGYYLGNKTNLLSMMQEGGMAPRLLGDVTLARALQRRSDSEKLEDYQRKEAKRQSRGNLFGSALSLLGGLAGGAIGGPAGAAIGSGLGKGIGRSFGAGKATDVDTTGTVYGQELFRDVERAGEEFDSTLLEDALVSGAKAGLIAGLSPSGGIYGDKYNPFIGGSKFDLRNLFKQPMSQGFIVGPNIT
tara:strand:+ start:4861 stop:5484 length:624 start_codon:yes stop_codon:yes gene_type:complete